ncbi:unnamed protein product [Paramecium octaurelia]|uniref:Alpha-1,3/1,6-mannosyltransferase ALG2 n=1 Tax=Paramecium octaurelia TaxID=43137 RepID=A0A8S1SL15_PAROT|nr:unnamed protein product [Paramecium octaurelia]
MQFLGLTHHYVIYFILVYTEIYIIKNYMQQQQDQLKIAFLHPDLGIGGAEQLVVNLALALQKNHYVKIYTPHHDPNHSFPETNGQIPVEVRGNIIPANFFGYCTAMCAYIRMILATLYIIFFSGRWDVIIIDQVSVCLPLLWLFRRKTIFYCHFPDKLLCVERKSFIKKIYRFFLDSFEEISMLFANLVLVNSQFTREIVKQAFPLYNKYGRQPEVLYPAIEFSKFEMAPELSRLDSRLESSNYFLSLNRYERKKNIALAIHAFAAFRQQLNSDENIESVRLVIAGGFEQRVEENAQHFEELNQIAQRQNVAEYVSFKKNISDSERTQLMSNALAVLYTPEREHFGIVPVEAMYNQVPVIACNSGGPKESIQNGVTGYLCESKTNEWCQRMIEIYQNKEKSKEMGERGRDRVIQLFGFAQFQMQMDSYVRMVTKTGKQKQQ